MRGRAATVAATAALLLVPASAPAAESASVAGGVLTYLSGDGTVDTVTISAGPGTDTLLSETTTPSGVAGDGCTQELPQTVRCRAVTSAVLETLDGDDTITVIATIPATVRGGDGADTITGGPAIDTIDAGDGADVLDVRGGGADVVDCGPGADAILFDPLDVLTGCDLPAPLPDPLAPVDVAVAPAALPAAGDVRVGADGVAPLELACAAGEADGCRGDVFLDPAPARRLGYLARRGSFGRAKFAIPAGGTATVRVRLSHAARRALGLSRGPRARAARRGRRVKAVVTVTERGKKPVKQKVKLHR